MFICFKCVCECSGDRHWRVLQPQIHLITLWLIDCCRLRLLSFSTNENAGALIDWWLEAPPTQPSTGQISDYERFESCSGGSVLFWCSLHTLDLFFSSLPCRKMQVSSSRLLRAFCCFVALFRLAVTDVTQHPCKRLSTSVFFGVFLQFVLFLETSMLLNTNIVMKTQQNGEKEEGKSWSA